MAWTSIPNFGDDNAKINERQHTASGANIVEVLYGARDADGNSIPPESPSDGHGHWLAIEIGGTYQMLSWRHPDYEGGLQEYGKGRTDNPLDDLEQDIAAKENICSRAETLAESNEWRTASSDMKQLFDEWKKIYNWHTPKEDELWNRFSSARSKFYDRRAKTWEANKNAKKELISQTAALSSSEEWNATSEKMKELMEQWKAIGSAGPDDNEALWQQFSTERQVFFDRRSKHYEELDAQHAVAKETKRTLISEAQELSSSTEWKTTSEKMKKLMEQWKAAGSAGRKNDEVLWDEFQSARAIFFDSKRAYFDERDRQLAAKADEKSALIQTASEIAASCDYSNTNAEKMKDLDRQWKAIGFCGKDNEKKLWEAFSETKENFWDGRKRDFEQRREERKTRLQEAITRKQGQISDLNGQIYHLEGKMEYVMSEEHIENMTRWIAEKKDKIQKLEKDISDIEEKLKLYDTKEGE